MTTAKNHPRRPRGPVRRPQILAMAVELVREQGLWNVRVSDVARRAHTSPAGVIYYFGTKDQLFEQAIAGADAAFYASLWPELGRIDTGPSRLACLIERSSRSEWLLWMDLWGYARRHPELLVAEREFYARWCASIADVVRHGQSRGEFTVTADAVRVAQRLAALTNGLAIRMVLDDGDEGREQYIDVTAEAAGLELGCDVGELRREIARLADQQVPEEPT